MDTQSQEEPVETKKKHVPKEEETMPKEEWRKGIEELENEPYVEEEEAKKYLKRNIELAITFIQKLSPLINGTYTDPQYICMSDGCVDFHWILPLSYRLICSVDSEDATPMIDVSKLVPGPNYTYAYLKFSTEQEQEKAINTVVKMLEEIPTK